MVRRILFFMAYSLCMAALIQVGIWASDRNSPFVLSEAQVIPPAAPGGVLNFYGKVKRDLTRECDLELRAWIKDSSGAELRVVDIAMTHAAIALREEMLPGVARMTAPIPARTATGEAVLHIESTYRCNPLHDLWPIVVSNTVKFEVTPR